MNYTINRLFEDAELDDVVSRTREALASNNFGILTEIDVKATLKKKIGEDIDDYLILGACNPTMALKALQIEPRVGAMLPCNVIIRRVVGGIEISAIDPVASMSTIDNSELKALAGQVRDLLKQAITDIVEV